MLIGIDLSLRALLHEVLHATLATRATARREIENGRFLGFLVRSDPRSVACGRRWMQRMQHPITTDLHREIEAIRYINDKT